MRRETLARRCLGRTVRFCSTTDSATSFVRLRIESMPCGIDKLILLSAKIEKVFLDLAREEVFVRYGYKNVIDLRQTRHKLPIILYCDGRHNGLHKIELVGVARLGLRRTRKILKMILGDLS